MSDREPLLKSWDEAWERGIWAAAWSKAVDGLTPAQAAWSPAPGRHSIWQIVHHLIFWREYLLRRLAGGAQLSSEEIQQSQWAQPGRADDASWEATRRRFADSQAKVRAALADPKNDLARIAPLLQHDYYHVGQICYLRAMQGLPPME